MQDIIIIKHYFFMAIFNWLQIAIIVGLSEGLSFYLILTIGFANFRLLCKFYMKKVGWS